MTTVSAKKIPHAIPSPSAIKDANLRAFAEAVQGNLEALFGIRGPDRFRALFLREGVDANLYSVDGRGKVTPPTTTTTTVSSVSISDSGAGVERVLKGSIDASTTKAIGDHYPGINLPAGAIITQVMYRVKTAFSGGAQIIIVDEVDGNVLLAQSGSGGSSWDLSNNGYHQGEPRVQTHSLWLPPLTANSKVVFRVSVADITAGLADIYVRYMK